jgi:LacI family transcriptional regulator
MPADRVRSVRRDRAAPRDRAPGASANKPGGGPGKAMKRSAPRAPVTLLDVARHVGVSRATVSLVLRDSPLVADATRTRVLAGFAALGYVYNRRAASLRSKRTHTVAVVVNDITNPYFATMIRSLEATLNRHGFIAFLSNSDESVERQMWFLEVAREHDVEGIVACPAEGTTASGFRRVLAWGIPCVFASRRVAGLDVDYVGPDNRRGMELATAHLIALGHRRIALIGGNLLSSTGADRQAGYLAALQAAKIRRDDGLIVPARLTREDGRRIITALLQAKRPPTAAVCGNDIVAFGVMLGLRAAGKAPGRDFAVMGFDDIPEASLWVPPLSTIQVRQDAIGEAAAELLLERLADPARPVARVVTEPSLVIRRSCGSFTTRSAGRVAALRPAAA